MEVTSVTLQQILKRMKKLCALMSLFFLMVTGGLNAQNATVTGNVFETKEGKQVPVEFAKVLLLNPDSTVFRGTTTDFDGKFKIVGVPGKVIFQIRASGLETYSQDLTLVAGANEPLTIEMFIPSALQGEVTVNFVKTSTKTEKGADNERMGNKAISEVMSKEQITKNGDQNVAAAVARIPGVTIIDGKYVFVRGLGDRYTKTIMNSIEIPGLDPDRNAVQLDIFPTALIDNISISKTFKADLAGDFTGGLVDVITKDAPTKQEFTISGNLGYNSVTTFNKNYQSYQGGRFDYMGIDDGTRALPVSPTAKIPDPTQGDIKTYKMTKAFNPVMGAEAATALPNHVYSVTYGNRKKNFLGKEGLQYGYVVGYNYRNTNSFRDVDFGNYMKNQDSTATDLETFRVSRGTVSENDVLWSGIYNNSFLFPNKFKLNVNLFHTQNGTKSASYIRENNVEGNQAILIKQGLQYSQRRITNLDVTGTHQFTEWKIRWDVAPTLANISDPDLRSTVLEEVHNIDANGDTTYTYELNPATGSQIRRIYRNLNEMSLNTKVNFSHDYWTNDSTLKSTISFGGANLVKQREFSVYDYFFELQNSNETSLNPNDFFAPENLWTPENKSGLYAKGQREPANQYTGVQMISGLFVMHDKTFSKRFDLNYGLRAEQAYNYYTGQNNNGTEVYNNEKVLDEFVLLPAVSFKYVISPIDSVQYQSILRGAFSKTVARPSFREKSIAQVFDPILGRTFNGNILLAQTDIYNFDFRWEKFFGRTELVSASAFYKRFYNPIEIATYEQAPNEVLPVNAGQADVYGLEFEIRKAIGFNSKDKKHLSLVAGTNLNYIISQIDMTKVLVNKGDTVISEYDNRVANARGDEEIKRYRPMYGQSPYSINAFVNFKNDSLGLMLNLSYNVQGARLAVIGVGLIPDVYERQFNSLNFKASKTFGENERWSTSLTVRNILNSTRVQYFQGNNNRRENYYSFKPGVSATASISLRLDSFKRKPIEEPAVDSVK